MNEIKGKDIAVNFISFMTETGRLSGEHMTTLAGYDSEAALRILDDHLSIVPESERPSDWDDILDFLHWEDDEQRAAFTELVRMGGKMSLGEARENFIARSIETGAMQGEEAVHFRDRIEDLSPEELEDFLKEANEGGIDG